VHPSDAPFSLHADSQRLRGAQLGHLVSVMATRLGSITLGQAARLRLELG
jgi:hypothetical protein